VTMHGWITRSLYQLLAILQLAQMSLQVQSNLPFTSFWHLKGSLNIKSPGRWGGGGGSERQEAATSADCNMHSQLLGTGCSLTNIS
jgi:hypothetical protein